MKESKRNRLIQAAPLCILAAAALLALLSAVRPLPREDTLLTAKGAFQRLERQDGNSFRLYVYGVQGYTEWYTIDDFIDFSPSDLTDAAKPGDLLSLRYADTAHRSVGILTANGKTVVSYDTVRRAYLVNRLWGVGVAVFLALGTGTVLLILSLQRKKKALRETEIRQTLELLEKERLEKRRSKPSLYLPEERRAVEEYIAEAFGPVAQVFYEPEGAAIRVDIAVVAPTEEENFYKLVTVGMGARKMDVPPELAERNCAFAELCMYLPPSWKLLSSDPDDTWPFHWLKAIARLPLSERDWLGVGHCVHTGPLGTGGELTELLLAWAAVREGSAPRLMLPGSRLVNFYQVLPLYAQEVRYRNERGFSRLWQRLMSRGVTAVVDLDRECCYDPETDFSLELTPFVWAKNSQQWTLGLYTGDFLQEQFDAAGLEGSGFDWEALAKAYLEKRFPQLFPYIHFDSEDGMFFAYTAAEDALRIFALAFREVCGDEDAFGELLTRISGSEA